MVKRNLRLSLCACLLAVLLPLSGCGIIILNRPTADTSASDSGETGDAPQDTFLPSTQPIPPSADQSAHFASLSQAYLRRITGVGYDFEGASFIIASPRTELLHPTTADNSYFSAVLERNNTVEDALNIRITSTAVDEESFFDQLHASVLADEYFADLLMIPEGKIGTFAAGGVLTNLKSMPLLDLTQPYYDADSIEAATAGNVVYAAAGQASREVTALDAVFFNRTLFEENGVDIPYSLVYEGRWTWDAFFATASSVSGINAYAAANGIDPFSSYSFQYAEELLPSAIYYSCGERFVRSTDGSSPVLLLSEDTADAAAAVAALFADPNAHKDTASGVARFHSGKSLYLLDRLYLMSWMPDSSHDWGILPLPKLTEEQENYITLADDSALFFAVQSGAARTARTSVVLSALNASSYGVLTEAYVDYSMNHLLRDNDSANMLELIAFSCAYDFALAFGRVNAALASATTAGMTDLAHGVPYSAILSRTAAADRELAARYQPQT